MSKSTIVINLFGVPGAGKSTGAAYIFAKLKMAGVNAELITEYAKDKVWEGNTCALKNQVYVFGKQYYKLDRCKDKVDVIVTDSPLILCAFYNTSELLGENFNQMVANVYNSFNNQTYFVERIKPYNPSGRLQTEEESNSMKQPLLNVLERYNIKYHKIEGNITFYDAIVSKALKDLAKNNASVESAQNIESAETASAIEPKSALL